MMKYNLLGKTDMQVSCLCYRASSLGSVLWGRFGKKTALPETGVIKAVIEF